MLLLGISLSIIINSVQFIYRIKILYYVFNLHTWNVQLGIHRIYLSQVLLYNITCDMMLPDSSTGWDHWDEGEHWATSL